ncbi:MAG: hypothetical protein WA783_04670 [Phormidesmis sp.]
MSFRRCNQSLVLSAHSFLLGRQMLTNAGAALLWPTFFVARYLIFGTGEGDRLEENETPYISKIQRLRTGQTESGQGSERGDEQRGELVELTDAKADAKKTDSSQNLDLADDCVA